MGKMTIRMAGREWSYTDEDVAHLTRVGCRAWERGFSARTHEVGRDWKIPNPYARRFNRDLWQAGYDFAKAQEQTNAAG